ncbi:MAG: hypothetical protein KGZ58_01470 [Ignavibacteriales bacterium]|nr:hypothetical protein [Ignavibacteriales bacterium]
MINFDCSNNDAARKTENGLECSQSWNGLPEWINFAKIDVNDNKLILTLQVNDAKVFLSDINIFADNIANDLSSLFCHTVLNFPNKVFCIGWSKTGTTSLTQALRILGLFSWHTAPWIIGSTYYKSDVSEISVDFSCIDDYTAISDLPVCALYEELDNKFPNSKFILTIRPIEAWIESALYQIESSIKKYGLMGPMARWAYGTKQLDRDLFVKRYTQHNQEVLAYFKGRSDLLVFDLSRGDQWAELCSFLSLPIPNTPFPFLNSRTT